MNIKSVCLGPVSANCYVFCGENGEGAVVDPGDYNFQLEKIIEECGIKTLKYIICTHSHFDHISGVGRLKEKHPDAQVVVGTEDAPALSDAVLSAAADFGLPFYPCYADKTVVDGDSLNVEGYTFSVVATPGHTKGGIILYCEKEKIAFTGDTLFKGSVGRTDLFGGNHAQLMESIKKIKKFAPDTVLLCGHGESTTVAREMMYNFYLL
jgi:glyoxylase-like metal-dependent hydrolase (beta-lactamase superfamily II)